MSSPLPPSSSPVAPIVIPEKQPFSILHDSLPTIVSRFLSPATDEFKAISNEVLHGELSSQTVILLLAAVRKDNADTHSKLDRLSGQYEDMISLSRNLAQSVMGLHNSPTRNQPPPAHTPKPPSYANAAAPPPSKKHKDYLGFPVVERNAPWAALHIQYSALTKTWGRYYWCHSNNTPLWTEHPNQQEAASLKAGPPSPPKNKGPPKAPKAPKQLPTLPTALRRFYATRATPAPFEDSSKWAASLPLLLANALEKVKAPLPLALSCNVNANGAVSITAAPTQRATDFTPFFPLLTDVLNDSLPVEYNHYHPFRLAPTTVDFAIHAVPLHVLPLSNEDLSATMKQAIRYASSGAVEIHSARYLINDPSKRTKATSSIVIAVALEDAPNIPSNINLFSRSRRCERLISTNAATQCRNCYSFGHQATRCKRDFPSCPFCNLGHTRDLHRCPNLGCEKGGNSKPVPGCCGASLLHCSNCGGMHTATSASCPVKVAAIAAMKARSNIVPPSDSNPPPNLKKPIEELMGDANVAPGDRP